MIASIGVRCSIVLLIDPFLFLFVDPIMAVGPEETAATLWGADKTDPKEALAENAFKMKNIVLTRPPGNPGGRRRPRTRKA